MFFRTVSRLLVLFHLASAPFQTIGTAALPNKGMPQSSAPAPVAKAGCTMQVLTNTEGVDFNQYLREVYLSVKKRWFANMPPSVEKGDQGVDSVEFRILQDGSVPKDSLKVVVSSRKTALDEASLQVFARQPRSVIYLKSSPSPSLNCASLFITTFLFLKTSDG